MTSSGNSAEIKHHGVSATPAIMIDGKIMHSGGIPSHEMCKDG